MKQKKRSFAMKNTHFFFEETDDNGFFLSIYTKQLSFKMLCRQDNRGWTMNFSFSIMEDLCILNCRAPQDYINTFCNNVSLLSFFFNGFYEMHCVFFFPIHNTAHILILNIPRSINQVLKEPYSKSHMVFSNLASNTHQLYH